MTLYSTRSGTSRLKPVENSHASAASSRGQTASYVPRSSQSDT